MGRWPRGPPTYAPCVQPPSPSGDVVGTAVRTAPAAAPAPPPPDPSGRAHLLDRHRGAVLAAGSAYLAVVSVIPVLTTPYRSDDALNRSVAERFSASGLSFVEFVTEWIGPWVTRDGRFFPGSATWTLAVFTAFTTREQYKALLAALVLTMVVLTATIVATLTRAALAPVVVVALASTLTLRTWFDGLDTFSGVLPLTVCLTLGSGVLLLRGRGWPSAVAAALLYGYALVTYEVAILLAPTLCLAVWIVRRRWTRTLPLVVPTVLVTVGVLVLRARATGSEGNAYRVSLEPWRVAVTYTKQAAAALPLSEQWFPGGAGLHVEPALVALSTVLVGVPAALVLVTLGRSRIDVPGRQLALAALLGASCWLLPPLLVAISLGWQNELPRGQGYVSVVWGYVGVAVLAAVAWTTLARATARPASPLRRVAVHLASAALALTAALTVAQSATIAAGLAATG